MTIVKQGDKFKLVSHTGKNLGVFATKAAAEKHEKQVQFFKYQHQGRASATPLRAPLGARHRRT